MQQEQFSGTQNSMPGYTPTIKPKRKWWVFAVGFVIILALGIIANWVWEEYLSPGTREARQMQEQYARYEDWQKSYDDALKADTYGGKTPEETLALFISALEKEDVDLASKYFMIESEKSNKLTEALTKMKAEKKLTTLVNILKTAIQSTRDTGSENSKEFVVINDAGVADYAILLKLNEQTKIWKIESL